MHLQGRIDGLYEDGDTWIVEEIKSLLIPPEHFNAITLGHYTAYEQQLTLYVHLLRQQHTGPVRGHLVLINVADNAAKVLVVEPEVADGTAFIVQQVRRILARYTARADRAVRRRSSVAALRFPFQTLRPYQEAMMEQIRLAMRDQSCVLLSASTGIGQPELQQLYLRSTRLAGRLAHLFRDRQTAADSGRRDLAKLAQQGVKFTAVHLRAKEKSCLNEIYYRHENVCEFARDYASKLERANLVERLLNSQ